MQLVSMLACILSVQAETKILSNTTLADFIIQERSARGLVNADRVNALLKEEALLLLQSEFDSKGYGIDDRTRKSFESIQEFRAYKNLYRSIVNTKKELKYLQQRAKETETRILDFCSQYRLLSDFLRHLQYADRIEQVHDLTIFVNSGSLTGDFRVAETKFQISDHDELYYPNGANSIRKHAVNITLDKRRIERDGLLHEIGHVLTLAADPRAYYRQLRDIPCDFDCQKNTTHPVALPAIQLQQWGNRLQKKAYPGTD